MKRTNIKNIKEVLDGLPKNLPISFKYKLFKINNAISLEYEFIKSILEDMYSEDYKEYETKRQEILKKYCKKDNDGNPLIENKQYVFDNVTIIKDDMQELTTKFQDTIREQEEKNKEIEAFIEEDVDIVFEKISLEELPDELIDKIEEIL